MTKREMTIEEALEIFKEVREDLIAKETELSKQVFENLGLKAVEVAIKILEQQPCEDCISREDAKNLFWNGTEGYDCRGFTRMEIGEMLDDLPSVTPSYNSIKTELKPCKDCISREAVIKIFGEVHSMDYNTQAYITNIQNLPSVTPKAESEWGSIGNNTDLETVPTNLQDWLSTFNTESATECFTAVQQLKERVNE